MDAPTQAVTMVQTNTQTVTDTSSPNLGAGSAPNTSQATFGGQGQRLGGNEARVQIGEETAVDEEYEEDEHERIMYDNKFVPYEWYGASYVWRCSFDIPEHDMIATTPMNQLPLD